MLLTVYTLLTHIQALYVFVGAHYFYQVAQLSYKIMLLLNVYKNLNL